ncbi:hypothetical protein CH063_03689 [Colletotrichum higginsianum]|uniref:Uncharacterized protein n=1 Tax=Colletotrichum higginsianum (strain IMI 349063) TaxID=759273 RepID=H1VZV0_COLHI|nr:hypothetical protein CH063_03689 [Colletotrichum higginsianum]
MCSTTFCVRVRCRISLVTLINVNFAALCLVVLVSDMRPLRIGNALTHRAASPADANRVADECAFCSSIAEVVVDHK